MSHYTHAVLFYFALPRVIKSKLNLGVQSLAYLFLKRKLPGADGAESEATVLPLAPFCCSLRLFITMNSVSDSSSSGIFVVKSGIFCFALSYHSVWVDIQLN